MKVKDLERTANVAWSPKNHYPILLAAGTAGQQLDASFNTSAALEIYSLNLGEPGYDLKLESALPSEHRFHKIIWGSFGSEKGTILTGCDGGIVEIYNADKLLRGESAIVSSSNKHEGQVHALDFNPFQQNLFASGAGESEIFIWDLNNTTTPMTPGAKSQPFEDVHSVAWNRQVQHILASTFASKCVIWDLRKNEPIIKLTDTVSRVRWKQVAWHPEVATQLCLASEEDHSPVIQVWDLRFATAPLRTLEHHHRGVLALSWSPHDSDLLLSCGKDSRLLCCNPNAPDSSTELLAELATTTQWAFDVSCCPRDPALLACPTFDGHVYIYSLMGGKIQTIQTTNKIADSFPGMEGYAQAPMPQAQPTAPSSVDLKKPPIWLRRPAGASFGFGGKLISFEHDKTAPQVSQNGVQPVHRTVQISQVITEPELVQKSVALEQALEYGNFKEYCISKADETNDQHKKYIWHFIKAHFDENPKLELMDLLGYKSEELNNHLNEISGVNEQKNETDLLSDQFAQSNRIEDFDFNNISQKNSPEKPKLTNFKISTGNDTEGLITQALILGNLEAAVELCLKANRFADALILAAAAGPELLERTERKYLDQSDGYVASLISATISENWLDIIENCDVKSWKEALVAALSYSSSRTQDFHLLCEQLGQRLENESDNKKEAQLCYICSGSFDKLVSCWSENAINSTEDLQELVELVMLLQRAFERQGQKVQVSGALADLLAKYAGLLAAQGNLQSAVSYLGASTDSQVTSLRDRLYVSLGQKPAYNTAVTTRQAQRRGSARTSFTQNAVPSYNNQFTNNNVAYPGANSYGSGSVQSNFGGGASAFNAPPPVVAPAQSFNTGLPAGAVNQAWQPQTVQAAAPPRVFSPAPVSAQPPRPPSTTSNTGSALSSRKYVLDPSVSSNQYGSSFAPRPQAFQPVNTSLQSPNAPLNPMNAPLIPSQPLNAPFNPPVPGYVPPAFNNAPFAPVGGYAPPPVATEAALAPPPLQGHASQPGWNDPPVLSKQLAQPKQDMQPQDPITHPLFGVAPEAQMPNNGFAEIPPYQGGGGMHAPPPMMQSHAPVAAPPPQMFQPMQQNLNHQVNQQYNTTGFNTNAVDNFNEQQVVQPVAPPMVEKAQPVVKAPIPEEHIHMKTVLDELKNQCSCASNNPQTKRKLEDVGKKLETLYDLLREHKLSPNTLQSLHQLVQMVQNGNYTGGLGLHTQLVSGPDFSQIASFMPGIKVLLQSALQLQVYLR